MFNNNDKDYEGERKVFASHIYFYFKLRDKKNKVKTTKKCITSFMNVL